MKKEVKQKKEILIHLDNNEVETRQVEMPIVQFTMATDIVFKISKEIGTTSAMLYLTLLSHRNTATNDCHPSITTLSKEMNINEKTIKRTLDKLYAKRYININSGMRGISNNYYFPQEKFYELFAEDYLQKNASRRLYEKTAITEKRETKLEKENKQLKEELNSYKRQYGFAYKDTEICDDTPDPF